MLARQAKCLLTILRKENSKMMKIQFSTSNAAFEEYGTEYQLECIFERILQRIKNGESEGKIQDINGNNIGQWSID